MKRRFISVLLIGFAILISFNLKAQEERLITVEGFQKLQEQKPNLVILDVRTPEEIAKGKIKDAQVLDFLAKDFEKKVVLLDKTQTYVVYCATGYRSGEATTFMRANGFTDVYDLKGGITSWIRKGLPLEK